MELKIIDQLCVPSREVNEDMIGYSGMYCWVLDGATELTDVSLLPHDSDARWYVERVDAAFREFSKEESLSLQEIVRRTIEQVKQEFRKLVVKAEILPYEVPSSAMALVRIRENYLDYGILGDCRVFVLKGDNEQISIGGSPLETLDQQVVEQLSILPEQAVRNSTKIKENVMPMLREHRALMNVEGGYWILSLSIEAAEHMNQGTIELSSGDTVLLVTDGFYRVVNTFNQIQESKLVENVLQEGLPQILERLRILEQSDPNCLSYPRLKPSDDATALVLKVNKMT